MNLVEEYELESGACENSCTLYKYFVLVFREPKDGQVLLGLQEGRYVHKCLRFRFH